MVFKKKRFMRSALISLILIISFSFYLVQGVQTLGKNFTPVQLLSNNNVGLQGVTKMTVAVSGKDKFYYSYSGLFGQTSPSSMWRLYNHGRDEWYAGPGGIQPLSARITGHYWIMGFSDGWLRMLVTNAKVRNSFVTFTSGPVAGQISGLDIDYHHNSIYFEAFIPGVNPTLNIYRVNLPKLYATSWTPELIQSTNFYSTGLAVWGDKLYISDYINGKIWTVPKTGGAFTEFASGLAGPSDLIFDSHGNLYVANNLDGTISYVQHGTHTVVTIASGFNGPDRIGVDGNGNVYFADLSNSGPIAAVWKLAK